MRLAVQLYSLREQIAADGLEAVLKAVKEAGFNEVETAGFYSLSAQDFRKKLDAAGLKTAGAHISLDEIAASPETVAAQAKILGFDLIVVPWAEQSCFENGFEAFAAQLNGLTQAYKKLGFMLTYHNHAHEFVAGDGLARLAKAVPLLTFEPDAFWLRVAGREPAAYIKTLNGRVKAVHIKEWAGGDPSDVNPVVGDGKTGCAEAAAAALAAGCDLAILEVENFGIPYREYLNRCYEKMKAF